MCCIFINIKALFTFLILILAYVYLTSTGYMIHGDIIALMRNEMHLCIFLCLNKISVLLSELVYTDGGSLSIESSCNSGDSGSIPGSGDNLEKEMATHSSILAWRIPWTEEPDGLQSIGSQRVRYD